MTTQKRQDRKILSLGPEILTENSAGGLRLRRERCWSYTSIFMNTLEKLIKSCCNFAWCIVILLIKSVSKLHANTSSLDVY